MSTLLQAYEDEYRETIKTIQDELQALRSTLNYDEAHYKAPPATGPCSRSHRCITVQSLLSHAKELINSMEYESNDLPSARRPSLRENIEGYRSVVRELHQALVDTKKAVSVADRKDLLHSSRAEGTVGGMAVATDEALLDEDTRMHRSRMRDNTAKFQHASSVLLKAERVLNETEDIGTGALLNLRTQTEQMQTVYETTIAVDEEISETRKILKGMQSVMIRHKAILLAIIMVLLFLIIVAIYVAVSKNKRNTPVQPTGIPVDPIPPTSSGTNGDGGLPAD